MTSRSKPKKFYLISAIPKTGWSYLDHSVLGRAQKAGKITIKILELFDFVPPKKRIDDKPYGGGPGMVLRAEPIVKSVKKVLASSFQPRIILLTPRGKQFTQALAQKWARDKRDLVLIAGRYEGVDARVQKIFKAEEISTGPYILSGGELPAMTIIDAVARHIPGVVGRAESLEEARVAGGAAVYTRPAELKFSGKSYKVPKVLRSGHHYNIDSWRGQKTSPKRPKK